MADLIVQKFLYFSLLIGSLPAVAQVAEKSSNSLLSTIIIIVFMVITILPELLCVFPTYRSVMIEAIKDGDGVMNRDDLKFFISWYAPFGCIRGIIFIVLFSMTSEYTPPNEIIWALVAVGAGSSLPHLKGMFK